MKSLGPAFQFYVDDFVGGTLGMSAADIGAYLLMLCHQWNAGCVPSKSRELGRITRRKPSQLGPVLAKFGKDGDGNYVNARMAQLRAERITYLNNQAAAGKASADKRKPATVQPPLQPPLQPEGQPEGKSPSPSPSPEEKTERERGPVPQDAPGQVRYIQQARDDWRLSAVDLENELKAMPTGPERAEVVRQFCADAYNGDKPRNPIGMLRGYISTANAHAKGATPARRPFPEQRKKAIEDLLRPLTSKSYPTDADRAEIQRLRNELKEVNNAIATG